MNATDLVYDTVYKRLKAAGVSELISKNQAIMAVDDFKKNKFQTVTKLIDSSVAQGKKMKIKKRG